MLGPFWKALSGKLAERVLAVAMPTALFWAGGLLAYLRADGVDAVDERLSTVSHSRPVVQVLVAAAAVVGLALSGVVVQRLTLPVLRLLEGYWPTWLDPLRRRLVARRARQVAEAEAAFAACAARLDQGAASASVEDQRTFVRLDAELRQVPATPDRLMPTRVGNILRAGESRPADKYGLEAVACWPHLWLVLPDTARRELSSARDAVDAVVTAGLWGLLFVVWAPLTPWAVPVGLLVAVTSWWVWLPDRARTFAVLLEAAYDVHRFDLYTALHWPLPVDPADERRSGALLTEHLWRGLDGDRPRFTRPANPT